MSDSTCNNAMIRGAVMLQSDSQRLNDGTPYHGRLGAIAYDPDEDRVQCHLCGGWFRQVGGCHLARIHGWTMEQYREAFELPRRVSTCAPGLSQQRRDATVRRISPGGDLAPTTGRFRKDRSSAASGVRTAANRRRSTGVRRVFYSKNPQLKNEWHPTRNAGLAPEALGVTSSRSVWWHCTNCGHDWQATIISRAASDTGCPAGEPRRVSKQVP